MLAEELYRIPWLQNTSFEIDLSDFPFQFQRIRMPTFLKSVHQVIRHGVLCPGLVMSVY